MKVSDNSMKASQSNFLLQGITPPQLALCVCLGFLIGIFPILGFHSLLVLLVIFMLRLNPAALFLISNLVFPLFFVFVIPFMRLGEFVFSAKPLIFSISEITIQMQSNPLKTIQFLGMGIIYAFVGWLLVAIPVGFGIYILFLKIFNKVSLQLNTDKRLKNL
jgi:uncharacterized protein (DUF2062 family)